MMDETSIPDGIQQLIDDGVKSLEIYWLEDVPPEEEVWWLDVHEDLIYEVCNTSWVWDILSQQQVDCDDSLDEYYGSLPTDIIVDLPFSENVVRDAVVGWLKERDLNIEVKVVSPDGRVAMERILAGIDEMENAIPLDEIDWEDE